MTTKHVLGVTAVALLAAGCGGGGGRTVPMRSIAIGSQVTGELRSSDPRLNDNSVYHLYSFRGNAGQTIQVDVIAGFDAFAILQDATGNELTRDDDGGEGLNARITYTLPSSGMYRIVANTYRQGQFGRYTLRLASLGTSMPSTGSSGGSISRGSRLTGRLASGDPRLSDNSVFHVYNYSGSAGETITVEVMSSDFDSYALIQDASGNRLASDDDSGEGLNARLTFTFPYSGTFRIIVNTYSSGSYGMYTLWVH